MTKEFKVLSPTAILGYGFPRESLERGISFEPDAIAVDAGSTDPGPFYLGEGVSFTSEDSVKRDLRLLLRVSKRLGIPLLISSAGGAGAKPNVEWTLRILKDLSKSEDLKLKVAIIWADVSKEYLLNKLDEGERFEALVPQMHLNEAQLRDNIKSSVRIVAQMGLEPFIEALKLNADVIVAGRSVDVAPFAAPAILNGFDKGLSLHMAKILECGALAADPGSGSDGMIGIVRRGEFEIRALNPKRKATKTSVAEHALYERTNPYAEEIPGGFVDLSNVLYEETEEGVIVKGSRWVESEEYKVKLEGVRLAGYRTIVIAGARDPDFISRLDGLLADVINYVKTLIKEEFKVHVKVYGRNAVLGESEPKRNACHEVGIILEVIAGSPNISKTVASLIRSTLLHIGWAGRKTTAGNLALPFSPSDFYIGRTYEWSLWHLIRLKDPLEPFLIEEVSLP